jgi:hypothetical protein
VNKVSTNVARSSRSVLVVELTRDYVEPPHWLAAAVSIPGRPAQFSRTWPTNGKPVTRDQIIDLCAWVESRVLDAIDLSIGAQEPPEGEE